MPPHTCGTERSSARGFLPHEISVRGGEVSVARIGKDGHDVFPLVFGARGERGGCEERRTRGDAYEKPLYAGDLIFAGECVLIPHRDDLVNDTHVQDLP